METINIYHIYSCSTNPTRLQPVVSSCRSAPIKGCHANVGGSLICFIGSWFYELNFSLDWKGLRTSHMLRWQKMKWWADDSLVGQWNTMVVWRSTAIQPQIHHTPWTGCVCVCVLDKKKSVCTSVCICEWVCFLPFWPQLYPDGLRAQCAKLTETRQRHSPWVSELEEHCGLTYIIIQIHISSTEVRSY